MQFRCITISLNALRHHFVLPVASLCKLKTLKYPQHRKQRKEGEESSLTTVPIFKLILQLMGSADLDARKSLMRLDYQSTSHILKALLFLAGLSSVNLQRLSSAGIIVVVICSILVLFTLNLQGCWWMYLHISALFLLKFSQ